MAEAANGREAIVLADYQRPEIILLDIQLPHVPGIAAAREISSKRTATRIIFVSTLTDASYVQEALKAGARGYVLGDTAQTDLPNAIRIVAQGGAFLSPAISANLIDGYKQRGNLDGSPLSDRDRQLFCWLAAGQNEQDIAQNLDMSVGSIQAECKGMWNRLRRLGLPNLIVDSMQAHFVTAET